MLRHFRLYFIIISIDKISYGCQKIRQNVDFVMSNKKISDGENTLSAGDVITDVADIWSSKRKGNNINGII